MEVTNQGKTRLTPPYSSEEKQQDAKSQHNKLSIFFHNYIFRIMPDPSANNDSKYQVITKEETYWTLLSMWIDMDFFWLLKESWCMERSDANCHGEKIATRQPSFSG